MSENRPIHTRLVLFLITQALIALIAVAVVSAASQEPISLSEPGSDPVPVAGAADPLAPTTLQVAIHSSPWAVLDQNNPGTEGPHVLVVEAVITNTGTISAVKPYVTLDYDDPVNNWVLLPGEEATRGTDQLLPGEAYHAYWFATYPTDIGATHQYTVTAGASNAAAVATSQNYYRPTGPTVEADDAQEVGVTRLEQTTTDIVVGVAFTATVRWSVGTGSNDLTLSPVGNVDFDASSYRLIASRVTLLAGTTPLRTVGDRLFLPTLPAGTTHARAEFVFLALRQEATQICPYAAPRQPNQLKYDNNYCSPTYPISGTVSLSLTKAVSAVTIKQGQRLTYTVAYTNNGDKPLGDVWIWDDVDPAVGSVIPSSIDPPSDPGETTNHRVAWYLGGIPEAGKLGSTGTLTFTILVDGGKQDLDDGQLVVNHAFFGIDPTELPAAPALTSTVTTTVQAPMVTVGKTDGLETVRSGEALTYTLRITNDSTSTAATSLVITDLLPAGVIYTSGTATPPETGRSGQSLVWNNLGPIPPGGGTVVITIPVTVEPILPNDIVLTDIMTATYQNEAGTWPFDPKTATDTTTVKAPIWYLTKADSPDPVVAGETLTYTLSYLNNGLTTAHNVRITDTLPSDVTFGAVVSQSPPWPDFSYNPGTPATLTWVTPTLRAGASGTIVFTVTVTSDAVGSIVNDVVMRSTEPATDTVDSESTTVNTQADLAITKSDSPDPVIAGTDLTYSLQVSNNGPSDATGVSVVDTLPPGVTFSSASPSQGSFDDTTGTWTVGSLADGASATLTLVVTVDSDTTGTLTNQAVVSGTREDPNPANDTATTTTTVTTQADLTMDKSASPSQVAAGATLTYTLAYANDGPSAARNVQIIDTLSAKVVFGGVMQADPPLPDPVLDGQQVTWSMSTLAAGASGTIVFTVTVNADAAGAIRNHVAITSSTPDDAPGNNEAEAVVFVGSPDLATIYGTVFEDLDGDGQWDDDEVGIEGVTVTLDGTIATTTDADGLYSFLTDQAGVHTVIETDPLGYFSTTPNEVHVQVSLGNSYAVNFGDAPNTAGFASLYGTVFEDLDGDRLWDDDEVGIEGVTVTLDGTTATTTDQYGSYFFSTTHEGVHTVVETDPADYFSTTPNEVHVQVSLGHGYQIDFGDAPNTSGFATLYGTVFDDLDSDGLWDDDEVGIEGVTVALDGATTATTDQYGSYTLRTTSAGVHTVVETDPPGYLSTTPNEVEQDVVLGNGYQVDFGDVLAGLCTCPPDAYEDDDVQTTANELGLDVRQHSFCDDDTDWTFFTAQANDVFTLTTSAGGPEDYWGRRADTYLALFDANGKLLVANDDYEGTEDYSSQIVWKAPAGGTYYLRTTNRAGLWGCLTNYTLWLEHPERSVVYLPIVVRNYATPPVAEQLGESPAPEGEQELATTEDTVGDLFSPSGVIHHACRDDYEVDDTWQQAHDIQWGLAQLHSFDSDPAQYAADKDFVWFEIRAEETITVTVTPVNGTQTLIELYDAQGTALDVSAPTQLVWMAPASGRYYLSISPSPQATTFGCADDVGYTLLAEKPPLSLVYLPIVVRSYTTR